jgi:L,D-peptidoglycan transpeptidase YkuD (ErfK/YbiS/YcfS/YnhG family)
VVTAGSAIFLHVAGADFSPTQGCVALVLADLLELLAGCGEDAKLVVGASEPPA